MEAIDELVQLKAESKRREREPLKSYVPSKVQYAAHASTARRKLCRFGNRTGKSTFGLIEDGWWLMDCHPWRDTPFPCKMLIVAKDRDLLGVMCRRLFMHSELRMPDGGENPAPIIPRWAWDEGCLAWEDKRNFILRAAFLKNGSQVRFLSADMGREKFQADWWHAAHLDDNWDDETIYPEITRGLIDRGGSLWWTVTPISQNEAMVDLSERALLGEEGVQEFRATIFDNPYLKKEEVEKYIADCPEEERKTRLYGEFLALEGLIYPMFGEHNMVKAEDVPKSGTRYIAIDPGYSHQSGVLWGLMAKDNEGHDALWFYRELYRSRMDYVTLCREIAGLSAGETIEEMVIDPAAKAKRVETMGESLRSLMHDQFNKIGFQTRTTGSWCVCPSNDVDMGIAKVRAWLAPRQDHPSKMPIIRVSEELTHLVGEMRRYRKRPDPKLGEVEKVVKKRDHLVDAMRYLVVHGPTALPLRERPEPSPIYKQYLKEKTEKDRIARYGHLRGDFSQHIKVAADAI